MGMTAFVLQALLKLDDKDFKKSLSDAESKTKGVGEKIGNGLKVAGKAAAAAVGAASVAIGKLALDATNAYSEYEQLVGGVETLFGAGGKSLEEYQKKIGITEKSTQDQIDESIAKYNDLQQAQSDVMDNAHKAFMNAGMDANTYMQTVTSFSASLLQGLNGDTLKAAQISDMAIIDMADNANKMGSSMESIQNAYQGFAKGQYQLLDNLKLGYGGTRSEMQRLLKDAEKIQKQQGKNVKYSMNNLADVYEAIHVVQEEMGITGTTAEEASKTIQGSTNMMKAAWMNLKIAMVSPDGDIGQAITDMVESVKVAAKNWIPAIKQALTGIGEVIKELAPIIAEELPGLLNDLLPGLIEGATSLISSLAEALPGLISTIVPILVETLPGLITQVIPALAEGAVTLVTALAQAFIDNIGVLADAVVQIIHNLEESFKQSDSPLIQMFGKMLEGVEAVFQWLIDNKETVVAAVGAIIGAFVAAKIVGFVKSLSPLTLILSSIAALASIIIANWGPISEFFISLWEEIVASVTGLAQTFKLVWNNILIFLTGLWESLKTTATNVWNGLKEAVVTSITFLQILLTQIWNSISSWLSTTWETIKATATDVWNGIKDVIHNAINLLRLTLETIWNGLVSFLTTTWEGIKSTASSLWNGIKDVIHNAINLLSRTMETIWNNITTWLSGKWEEIKATAERLWNALKDHITKVWEDIKTKAVDIWEKIKRIFNMESVKEFTITITCNFVGDAAKWMLHQMDLGVSNSTIDNLVNAFWSWNAKGDWTVPYDNYPAILHRNEMVLTASQARRYRDGEGGDVNYLALINAIVVAIRQGLEGAQVNSYLDGNEVTDAVNRILGDNLAARRFA